MNLEFYNLADVRLLLAREGGRGPQRAILLLALVRTAAAEYQSWTRELHGNEKWQDEFIGRALLRSLRKAAVKLSRIRAESRAFPSLVAVTVLSCHTCCKSAGFSLLSVWTKRSRRVLGRGCVEGRLCEQHASRTKGACQKAHGNRERTETLPVPCPLGCRTCRSRKASKLLQ
jgi:hypothetical protein